MQTEFIRSQQVLKAMCRIFILRIGLMWGNGYTHYSLSGIPKVFFALKLLRPTERRTHRIITPIHKNKCRFRDKHEMCDLTIPNNKTKLYLHLPPSTAHTNLQSCIYCRRAQQSAWAGWLPSWTRRRFLSSVIQTFVMPTSYANKICYMVS